MINDYKPNDFVAATLNSAGKLTLDDFKEKMENLIMMLIPDDMTAH